MKVLDRLLGRKEPYYVYDKCDHCDDWKVAILYYDDKGIPHSLTEASGAAYARHLIKHSFEGTLR